MESKGYKFILKIDCFSIEEILLCISIITEQIIILTMKALLIFLKLNGNS